jgi:aminopeptidase N
MTSTKQVSLDHNVHYLSDYKSPTFTIDKVDLVFELHETKTIVHSTIKFQKLASEVNELILNGENLELLSVKIDNKDVSDYKVTPENLIISHVPEEFTLTTSVKINPTENKTLNGLYLSNGNFATQCEPHGFRCITYFLDRPDVMTVFKVKILADKSKYPVLLSNGNLIESGDLADNKHYVEWYDPTLKPCYLFALVAGSFEYISKKYTTMSGRDVDLRVYVENGKLDQAHFAIDALASAMKWDEDVFKREYELDIYMIVAVSDFNFGAMENKGLNIFNDQYILANPKLATDQDYTNILGVVGHEYFHNWSGNRVTCRDWFQLSLKEGLTIFRDQSFTADMTSGANKRIGDVFIIKNYQFAEDSGPMSHPIRPESYVSMNNFYTTTVYNKGAEVIRMIKVILGEENFAKGMDEYFSTNDGLAVTTDDFVTAMEVASGYDLTQFRLWYSQSGTPHIKVTTDYIQSLNQFKLKLEQYIPNHPDAPALHIPIKFALLGSDGEELSFDSSSVSSDVIHLKTKSQEFIFNNVTVMPIISLLRDFSAPVQLEFDRSDEDLSFLLMHDKDPINKWDASSTLLQNIIKNLNSVDGYNVPDFILDAFKKCIKDKSLDKEFIAKLFTMPSIKLLMMQNKNSDVVKLANSTDLLQKLFAEKFSNEWIDIYEDNISMQSYEFNPEQVGSRALRNLALLYIGYSDTSLGNELIIDQYNLSDNMTDQFAAMVALSKTTYSQKENVYNDFYEQYKDYPLVIDKWLRLIASDSNNGLDEIKNLLKHPGFDPTNPNRVRAVLGVYSSVNVKNFHDISGQSYEFIVSEIIRIDKFNPQLAARLCEPFIAWRLYDEDRQVLIKRALDTIYSHNGLSKDVAEIVGRSKG